MKKSKNVPATLLTAVAAIMVTGCGSGPTEVRRCVDSSGNVLPDSMCTGTTSGGGYYGGTGSSYYSRPHWVYGGSMSGSRISGSHLTPSDNATVTDTSGHTISRGGFGSSGGGSGS